MVQITIQIDGDKVAINQSAAPTKVENTTTKRYFVVMGTYDTHSYIELVTEDYIEAINKLKELKSSDNSCFYTLHIQEDGEVYLVM